MLQVETLRAALRSAGFWPGWGHLPPWRPEDWSPAEMRAVIAENTTVLDGHHLLVLMWMSTALRLLCHNALENDVMVNLKNV